MMDHLFGDVRSILAHAPSAHQFNELLDLVGPEHLDPTLMDYVRESLRQWPKGIERAVPESDEWLRADALAWCTHVERWNHRFAKKDMRAFVGSRHLGMLRHIDLSRCRLTTKSLHALLTSEHLGRVEVLDVSGPGNSLKASFADVLLNAPSLRTLCVLNVGHNLRLGGPFIDGLSRAQGFPALQTLSLVNTGALDISRFFLSNRFPVLEHLDVSFCKTTPHEGDLQGECLDMWSALSALNVSGGDVPWSLMARVGVFDGLEDLVADEIGLRDEDVEWFLALLPTQGVLKTLSLSKNQLTMRGLDHLMRSPKLENLERFFFTGNALSSMELRDFPSVKPPSWTTSQDIFMGVYYTAFVESDR